MRIARRTVCELVQARKARRCSHGVRPAERQENAFVRSVWCIACLCTCACLFELRLLLCAQATHAGSPLHVALLHQGTSEGPSTCKLASFSCKYRAPRMEQMTRSTLWSFSQVRLRPHRYFVNMVTTVSPLTLRDQLTWT